MSETVSVVMPTRDASAFVDMAMASILCQTYSDYHLYVVDDGSTDDTPEKLNAYARHDRVSIRLERGSRGLAVRLNECIEESGGALIARMDADDMSYPDRLRRQVDHLRANPSPDLCSTSMLVIDGSNRPRGVRRARPPGRHLLRTPAVYHPTWLMRREWCAANPYNPRLRKAEDQELLFRTRREASVGIIPDILVAYRVTAEAFRKAADNRIWFARGLLGLAPRDPGALVRLAAEAAKLTWDVTRHTRITEQPHLYRTEPVPAFEENRFRRCAAQVDFAGAEVRASLARA